MAVPSVTNEFGDRYIKIGELPYGWTTGQPWWDNVYCSQRRWPHSKNPIRPEISKSWRDAAPYFRHVRRYTQFESSVRDAGWYKIYSPPGDGELGRAMISSVPGYTDHGWDAIYDESLRHEAEAKALVKIGDRKVSLGESIAEASKTYDHLARTSADLLRAFIAARHGRWKEIPDILGMSRSSVLSGRFPANRWLEYQYGWKPLLGTIHDAYNLVTQQLRQPLIVHGKGKAGRRYPETTLTWDGHDGLQWLSRANARQDISVSLYATFDNSSWADLHKLSLINPLAIAWELVPYSFVLDWFMPVGNVLEASTATAGLDFLGGSYTWVTEASKLNAVTGVWNWPPLQKKGRLNCDLFIMKREVYSDWPRPSLYARQQPFSTSHTASALALFRSSVKIR